MKYLLATICILLTAGCSGIVHPNPRLLFTDGGQEMGDAATQDMPDAWAGEIDGGASGVCTQQPGQMLSVVSNDCSFLTDFFTVIATDCPRHQITGSLAIVCDHMYTHVGLNSDPTDISCDGGLYQCNTTLDVNGVAGITCFLGHDTYCHLGLQ
jgi:hypothetical protein